MRGGQDPHECEVCAKMRMRMRSIHLAQGIILAPSKISGYGVFAVKPFLRGELIETCPVIVIPASERSDLDKTVLFNYYYEWGGAAALAQGFGSFYNHSYEPNAAYKKDISNGVIEVSALRDIEIGEEVTINYNGAPDSKKPVWFEADSGSVVSAGVQTTTQSQISSAAGK